MKIIIGGVKERLQNRRGKKEKKGCIRMVFNAYSNGVPTELMYYKGDYYIGGTKLTLKDEYIQSHKYNNKKLWKYAKFGYKLTYNNRPAYFFWRTKHSLAELHSMGYHGGESLRACMRDYAPGFVVYSYELENAIEEITDPIKLSKEENTAINKAIMDMIEHPKRDWDDPTLLALWIIYIAVMIGSLIFNEFYIIWIIASIAFYYIREGML